MQGNNGGMMGMVAQMLGPHLERSSDDERRQRAAERVEALNVDADTLLSAEYGSERVIRQVQADRATELGTVADENSQLAGVMQVLGNDALPEKIASILLADPRIGAEVIIAIDAAYRDAGLYDELGIERPSPGAFAEIVDV